MVVISVGDPHDVGLAVATRDKLRSGEASHSIGWSLDFQDPGSAFIMSRDSG